MYEELIKALRLAADKQRFGNYPTITVDVGTAYNLAAAIESMNDQIAALQAENTGLRALHRTERCEAAGYDCAELGRARDALARVEKERDAALADVPHECYTCKHKPQKYGLCGMGCEVNPVTIYHAERCKWEWHGGQGEG